MRVGTPRYVRATIAAAGALLTGAPLTHSGATAAPALSIDPPSRSVSVARGATAPSGNARVVISGDDRPLFWTATVTPGYAVLITATGAGTSTLTWRRDAHDLLSGVYVDTIRVRVANAIGSPAQLIDSLIVLPDAPEPASPQSPADAIAGGPYPAIGRNSSMRGRKIFPATDLWNQPVDTAKVDPNSGLILDAIGLTTSIHPDFGASWNGGPFGFTYIVVPETQPRVPVKFQYSNESDPGPYPLPPHTPIEAGDGHVVMITQKSLKLFETYGTQGGPPWSAGSGAIFDLVAGTARPAGWTSADAAGLPIFPGLVRYDEVYETGAIEHAIRFTVTRSRHAYVAPATHQASESFDPRYAPMGMRVRLKASVDISHFPAPAQVILKAFKKYGMIVADNGGNFFFSGTADARWDDSVLNTLKTIKVSDFEVVRMTGMVVK